jgi:hypothetical protein
MDTPTLTIELSPEAYDQLRRRAEEAGKAPEALSRELLEDALRDEQPPPKSAREILEAAGMVRPLGPYLESKIIPGVTLEEVQRILTEAGGPSLSEIILEQRGPKE